MSFLILSKLSTSPSSFPICKIGIIPTVFINKETKIVKTLAQCLARMKCSLNGSDHDDHVGGETNVSILLIFLVSFSVSYVPTLGLASGQ